MDGVLRPPRTRLEEAFDADPVDDIVEMTVGNMTRLLGISPEDAVRLRKEFGNSNIAAYMYASWVKNNRSDQYESTEQTFDDFLEVEGDDVWKLVGFVGRFPHMEKRLSQAEDPEQALLFAAEYVHSRGEATPKTPPEIRYPDGFTWTELKDNECALEGGLMQHCGATGENGRMYSLRDGNGKPHVTLELADGPFKPFFKVPPGTPAIVQLRGKQNSEPSHEYMKYIKHFQLRKRAVCIDTRLDWKTRQALSNIGGKSLLLPESIEETIDSIVQEAPPKKQEPTHLTAQRNIPREAVNAMTVNPALRQSIWQISVMPKGTQAARLLRFLEDKGWRQTTVAGRRLLYHGRSFRMLDDVRPPTTWTVYSVYSMFRPREMDDDLKKVDRGLLKSWGMSQLGDYDEPVLNTAPGKAFISLVTSPEERQRAAEVADQLYQHTGIALEPLSARLPVGEPVRREDLPRTSLPQGVDPTDVLVVAEGGMFYALLAKDLGPNVLHDSRVVFDRGRTSYSGGDPLPAGEAGGSDDWEQLRKRYGMKGKGHDFGDGEADTSIRIRGDGGLGRIAARAASLGKDHIFLVPSGSKGKLPEIPTNPVPLEFQRGGLTGDEPGRVTRNLRGTGGLPVKPGRWAVADLRQYLRMFARDHGTQL